MLSRGRLQEVQEVLQMKLWFLKRSYREHVIDFEMKRSKF